MVPAMAVLAVALAMNARLVAQTPETTTGFDCYIAAAEARIAQARSDTTTFLTLQSLPSHERADTLARLQRGEVLIESRGNRPKEIPGGLIHDWVGTVFVRGVTLSQLVAMVRDYDHHTHYYAPDVLRSRLISARGDDLHVFMRLKKQKVVSVVLDTEYDVHYGRIDAAHQYSTSRSTRVSEIAAPGTPGEHALLAGHDHGYMWRLNTYWAFQQTEDGVFVECEAISLTRDIPTGMAWLIGPFVNSIPRESLRFTLNATRAALNEGNGHT